MDEQIEREIIRGGRLIVERQGAVCVAEMLTAEARYIGTGPDVSAALDALAEDVEPRRPLTWGEALAVFQSEAAKVDREMVALELDAEVAPW